MNIYWSVKNYLEARLRIIAEILVTGRMLNIDAVVRSGNRDAIVHGGWTSLNGFKYYSTTSDALTSGLRPKQSHILDVVPQSVIFACDGVSHAAARLV